MSHAADEPALMVRAAVALPLPSNVIEFVSREQVAPPVVSGCIEQVRATGFLKLLSSFIVTVELALWPALRVLGLSAVAEIEKSVPVFTRRLMAFCRISTRSGAPSPLTSKNLGVSRADRE